MDVEWWKLLKGAAEKYSGYLYIYIKNTFP